MHNTAPDQMTPSLMGLILFGGLGLGLLVLLGILLRTLTGRSSPAHPSSPAGTRWNQTSVAMMVLPFFAVAGLLLAVTLLYAVRSSDMAGDRQAPVVVTDNYSKHMTPVRRPASLISVDSDRAPTDASESDLIDAEDGSEAGTTERLPDWTQTPRTVLADGQVPHVLFVETSGLYSTEEEAMAEALTNAISKFRERLAEDWTRLAVQPVPEHLFREASVQKIYTEQRMHRFGAYEEPMYRVYLQYADSAEAREPVIEAWKNTFAGNRAMQYGIGFGILIALLGVVSAGLRAVSAARGSRGRAVMTALVFAGTALAGLMFVG